MIANCLLSKNPIAFAYSKVMVLGAAVMVLKTAHIFIKLVGDRTENRYMSSKTIQAFIYILLASIAIKALCVAYGSFKVFTFINKLLSESFCTLIEVVLLREGLKVIKDIDLPDFIRLMQR